MKSFKTESKKILDIMINSIYTNKEIFLRELISNGSDAIDKAYFKALGSGESGATRDKYFVRIKADKQNNTLTIEDNGIGMTSDELENNLGTIAHSGSQAFKQENKSDDIDIIGQFGVGFYSAFMVANKVEVLSKTDSGEANKWVSQGADGYEITKAEKDEVGTTITLHIKPDTEEEHYSQYLEEYTLRSLIKKYSDYIRYQVQLWCEEECCCDEDCHDEDCHNEEHHHEHKCDWQTINSMVPLWKRNKKDITKEEYDNFYQDMFYDEAPARVIHYNVEGAVDYKALLFIPKRAEYNFYSKNFEKGLRLYTDGVLITEKQSDLLPDYFGFVKGLVDTELSLNISRETIQQNRQLHLIAQNIENKVKNDLMDMLQNDRENYEKFFEQFGMQLKYGIYSSFGAKKDLLQDLLMFRSLKNDKMVTLKEYVDAMPEGQTAIYYATGKNADAIKHLPQCAKVTGKGYDVLCFTQDIDEFATKILGKYSDKDFKSVSSESVEDDTTTQNVDLCDFMKKTLADKVAKVKCTSSLEQHPVCLSVEGDLSIEMEKVLKNTPNAENISAEKVLEINVNHPVYTKLVEWLDSDKDKLEKATKVLYQQARIIEGLPVDDPTELASLVGSFIAESK